METFEYSFKRTSNYHISLEMCAGHIFVHCTIAKLSKSVYKEIKDLVYNISAWCSNLGYPTLMAYAEDPSFLLSITDAEYTGTVEHKDKIYEVFKWQQVQQ